jgi:hypothetical protein
VHPARPEAETAFVAAPAQLLKYFAHYFSTAQGFPPQSTRYSEAEMFKRRVALLCDQNLLGEILEDILVNSDEVEFIGVWGFDDLNITRFAELPPGLLVIADEVPPRAQVSDLMAEIQTGYPEIPIIRVTLAQNDLRIYTSHSKPARRAELIDLIRQLPGESPEDIVPGKILEEDGGEANAN